MARLEPSEECGAQLRVAVREPDRLAGGGGGRRERAVPGFVGVEPRDAREPEIPRQLRSGDPGLVARDAGVDEALEVRLAARRS